MLVNVEKLNGKVIERELTAELIDELNAEANEVSGDYSSFVLSAYADEITGKITFYFDGPWEC